ncbi:MAG: 8-oxoguanine deaminase [Halioglobus sp.]
MAASDTASRIWLKNPLAILSAGNADGGLVIEAGKIVELVASGHRPEEQCQQVFDASKHVVLPGLVNTHHHFYQTLTRVHRDALGKPLFPWLQSLYPVWAKLSPEHIALSTRLALVELLLSGCTTAADHHYLFPPGLEKAIDIQAEVASDIGIRAMLTRGSMSLSQKDGGLPPDTVVQDEDAILADSERLIDKYHQREEGAMLQIALAPCSPFSVTREIMVASSELARKHGVRLHTHLAETHDETDFCLDMFGMRPVDYLEDTGWLNPQVWLAHGIHFSDSEVARLGAAGVGISHCPSSNMILASGVCQTLALENAGASVGLGVDGSASNDGSNMMQEVRMAFLLQRLYHGADRVGHLDALRWATEGSARCLGRDDIGSIAVGKQADLAMFCLDELRFSGSGDPLAALVLCGAHRADRVMVKGEWLVADGEYLGGDVAQLIADHSASALALHRT